MNRNKTPKGLITSSGSSDHLFKTLKEKYGTKASPSALEQHFKGPDKPVLLWNDLAKKFYRNQLKKINDHEIQAASIMDAKRKASDIHGDDSEGDNGSGDEPSEDEEQSDEEDDNYQEYIRVATTTLRKLVRPDIDLDTVRSRLLMTQESISRVMSNMETVLSHFTDMVLRGDLYKFIGYDNYSTEINLADVFPADYDFGDHKAKHSIASLPFINADAAVDSNIFTFAQFQNMFYSTVG
ncbi:hypothetical protein EC973_008734, partial [Apophysomyces ossiformis]